MRLPSVTIIDQAPAGWHILDVRRRTNSRTLWAAIMINVPAEEHCSGQHPASSHVWVAVPGKHRTRDAAWDAFEDMLQTRH